jgi:hypothetical protein
VTTDTTPLADTLTGAAGYNRGPADDAGLHGLVTAEVFDAAGNLKQRVQTTNLVTQVGDQVYGERGAGVGAIAAPTGMRLGTGTTAAAKTGAGAAIVTYVSGSSLAFDATYPQSALNGASRRITYRRTWAAGVATATGIAEVVITNEAGPTNVAGTAANTTARALLSSAVNKEAGDSLVVTWTHDLLGA